MAVPFLPKQISLRAISLYLASLAIVCTIFYRNIMGVDFLVMGIIWVILFFALSSRFSKIWGDIPEKKFIRKVIWTALTLRVIWVIFSYFFYFIKTGIPFEFGSSDALGYHNEAIWFLEIGWGEV